MTPLSIILLIHLIFVFFSIVLSQPTESNGRPPGVTPGPTAPTVSPPVPVAPTAPIAPIAPTGCGDMDGTVNCTNSSCASNDTGFVCQICHCKPPQLCYLETRMCENPPIAPTASAPVCDGGRGSGCAPSPPITALPTPPQPPADPPILKGRPYECLGEIVPNLNLPWRCTDEGWMIDSSFLNDGTTTIGGKIVVVGNFTLSANSTLVVRLGTGFIIVEGCVIVDGDIELNLEDLEDVRDNSEVTILESGCVRRILGSFDNLFVTGNSDPCKNVTAMIEARDSQLVVVFSVSETCGPLLPWWGILIIVILIVLVIVFMILAVKVPFLRNRIFPFALARRRQLKENMKNPQIALGTQSGSEVVQEQDSDLKSSSTSE